MKNYETKAGSAIYLKAKKKKKKKNYFCIYRGALYAKIRDAAESRVACNF